MSGCAHSNCGFDHNHFLGEYKGKLFPWQQMTLLTVASHFENSSNTVVLEQLSIKPSTQWKICQG